MLDETRITIGEGEDGKSKGLTGEEDAARMCRICHLSRLELDVKEKQKQEEKSDVIQLGCGCRGELGFAHSLCAEAWFMLKGNRICEICGRTVQNVVGTSDSRLFMEEWNENGLAASATTTSSSFLSSSSSSSSSSGRSRCWREEPLCNFLMACLVLAFVLPWFFRVDLF